MASSMSIIVHENNKLEETTFLYQPLSKFWGTMWVDYVHTHQPQLATSRPCINSPTIVQMTSNLAQEGAQSNICEMMLFAPCHDNLVFFFIENHAKTQI